VPYVEEPSIIAAASLPRGWFVVTAGSRASRMSRMLIGEVQVVMWAAAA
jgi:hypothetical protein